MSIKVKVCGMRESMNLAGLQQLKVDYVGLIFYKKSPRFVEAKGMNPTALQKPLFRHGYLGTKIEKVGVFVNASLEEILDKVKTYHLDYVQLHGKENLFYCRKLQKAGVRIIKAFSVDEKFSFTQAQAYQYDCDYFLFDTKGKKPGGNGYTFDWKILEHYHGKTPFFLSGGIQPGMAEAIRALQHPQLFAVDLNSGFEIQPGFKDVDLLATFINALQRPAARAEY